ncbi:transcriptional regulator [Peribacillus asahii]|uniref:Transcriptional regulator n=1 Tax=Peribacillus asahii TaxID=228899 RepID=A0A3Q9RK80_9BACI|nr:helix-turn-helix transcriptional regulator [Peribacillus asahii]AZV43623.1 transcriptional regulator [Peribacillus asahii]
MMKVNVGDFLRLKRLEKRMTLSDIASKVGVSTNYISEIEKGTKSNPSDDKIIQLAEIFNLNEDDLFVAFNKLPLSARKEIYAHPSLAKALSELNNDQSLSYEKKEQFYNKLVYWYKKISEEDN